MGCFGSSQSFSGTVLTFDAKVTHRLLLLKRVAPRFFTQVHIAMRQLSTAACYD